MLSLSLLKSLSMNFHTHIISHKPDYSIQSGYTDVALILKTILSQVFPTTMTGTNNVLTQLSQLDIKDHENNLLTLHQEFKRLVGIMNDSTRDALRKKKKAIKSTKKKKGKEQPKSRSTSDDNDYYTPITRKRR